MAGHRQLAPAAQRKPVDGRHHRLPALFQSPEDLLTLSGQRLARPAVHRLQLGDVGPGHEGLGARAGKYHAADRRVGGHPFGHRAEVGDDGIGEGIEFVRAVDGDRGDPVVRQLEKESGVGHAAR